MATTTEDWPEMKHLTSVDDESALIAAVRANTAGSREVYADWLEQRGHLDRAVFLRRGSVVDALADMLQWVHGLGALDTMFIVAPGMAMHAFASVVPITPGTDAIITIRPSTPFRPTQLLIPEAVAHSFTILDARVGHVRQWEHQLSALFFTPRFADAHQRITFRMALPGDEIALTVRNTGHEEREFFAMLFGQRS